MFHEINFQYGSKYIFQPVIRDSMVLSVQNPAVIIVKLLTIVTILMDTVVTDAKVDIPGQNVIEVRNTNHRKAEN
jgi:hypothetical protein